MIINADVYGVSILRRIVLSPINPLSDQTLILSTGQSLVPRYRYRLPKAPFKSGFSHSKVKLSSQLEMVHDWADFSLKTKLVHYNGIDLCLGAIDNLQAINLVISSVQITIRYKKL